MDLEGEALDVLRLLPGVRLSRGGVGELDLGELLLEGLGTVVQVGACLLLIVHGLEIKL
jgi:hypothetical protein